MKKREVYRSGWMLCLLVSGVLMSLPWQAVAGTGTSFSGTVDRGEDFSLEFADGLEFRLDYIRYQPEGWAIRISDPLFLDENFCSVVTPPYRGTNALQILDWHFLNEGGTGPNDGSVNAPGEIREFFYVTGREDFSVAFDALSRILWPESDTDAAEATELHDSVPRMSGILRITELTLEESPDGSGLRIGSISFDVELD